MKADIVYQDLLSKGKKFNFKKHFLYKNVFKMISAFLSGMIALVLFSELVVLYTPLAQYSKSIFCAIGFSGSLLVFKYLNKIVKEISDTIDGTSMETEQEDTTDQTQTDNIMSQTFEYALNYLEAPATIEFNGKTVAPRVFAQNTKGVDNPSATEIVWQFDPMIDQVTLHFTNGTSQIAGPVRRPKEN